MTEPDEPRMRYATINWFQHVLKGDVPEVFRHNGFTKPLPGDGIFCEIEVGGVSFACTVLANTGTTDVSAQDFELAINTLLAALRNSVDAPRSRRGST